MPIEMNGQEWAAALRERGAAVEAGAEGAALAGAEVIAFRARDNVLEKWHAKGTPTPSSPGQPPASISYDLAGSIEARPGGVGAEGPEADVVVGVKYGEYQEFGTSRGLPERPFLGPAIDQSQEEVGAAIAAALARYLI